MDMLLAAEWDIQLQTGWTTKQLNECEAERLLTLHLRWQYNQLRYSGFMPRKKGRSAVQVDRRTKEWQSQTINHADGRVTRRINLEDLWNPQVAQMINNAGGQ